MKKKLCLLCSVMFSLLILLNPCALAEDYVLRYSYSTQLTYLDGTFLPPSPLSREQLSQPLNLFVQNETSVDDTCMLLCFLNGHLVPYSIDEQLYDQYQFETPSNTAVNLGFSLDLSQTDIPDESVLYIVTVGLLDTVPAHVFDSVGLFSNYIAIPLRSDSPALQPKNNANWQEYPSSREVRPMYVYYPFSPDALEDETGKFQADGTPEGGYDLTLVAEGDGTPLMIALMVDHQLTPLNDDGILTLISSPEKLYTYTAHLDLSPGTHQLYCIYMSVPSHPGVWNSDKLLIHIPEGAEAK